MLFSRFARSLLTVVAVLFGCAGSAHAAQSYDNCTGFITSLPAVITTQGTWCLKSDLTTAITSGNAITINTNNVTLDCNDFKLGGLAAGTGTQTKGIYAVDRLNATIRHCNIRGFLEGVYLAGTGGGHVVEDNRLDGNTFVGLDVEGDGSVVRRNRIFDTGGSTLTQYAFFGIYTSGLVDIEYNVVTGVTAIAGGGADVYGINPDFDRRGMIVGNGVRDLFPDGAGVERGIYATNSDRLVMRGNDVAGQGTPGGSGLRCTTGDARVRDNEIAHFSSGIVNCANVSGNDVSP